MTGYTIRLTDEARALARADGATERAVLALDGTEHGTDGAALDALRAILPDADARPTAYGAMIFSEAWRGETGATRAVCEITDSEAS